MTTTDLTHAIEFAWSDLHEGEPAVICLQAKIACRTLAKELTRLAAIVDRLNEHLTKTRKAANERIKRHGQDGLAIQLQSEATLLDMILHAEATP